MTSWVNDPAQNSGNIGGMFEHPAPKDSGITDGDGAGQVYGDSLHWMMCLDHQLSQYEGPARLGV